MLLILKRLIIFSLLSLTLSLSACVTTTKVVYKDIPEGYVPVKRETLDKLVEELNMTRYQLLECWEKLR